MDWYCLQGQQQAREEQEEQVEPVAAEQALRTPRPVQWVLEPGAQAASSRFRGTSRAEEVHACYPGPEKTQAQKEQREERANVQPFS